MDNPQKVMRFGVMIDGFQLKQWQLSVIERLLEDSANQLVVVIKSETKSSYNASKIPLGYRWIERQLRQLKVLQPVDASSFFASTEIENITPSKKGISNYITTSDCERLKTYHLDFVIRFGFGIIRGEILDLPKYGIWSFHHGNPEQYRGGPPGFWEFLHAVPTNGLILQRLTNELDAGVILRSGEVRCRSHSFLEHMERLFTVGIDFPRWVSAAIRNNQPKIVDHKLTQKGPIYKVPSNWKVGLFYFKIAKAKVYFHLIQLFRSEIWNSGMSSIFEWSDLKIKNIEWLPEVLVDEYQADPFYNPTTHELYFEWYNYQTGKGKIAKRKYHNGSWSNLETVIDDGTHFSYPYLIDHNNQQYIFPENYEAKEIALYQKVDGQFQRKSVLLNGSWVDGTLFLHQNKWWLFCSPQENSNEELHLFYSNTLEGEYSPHELNPIKINVRGSRPGGAPFVDDNGRLVRPAQNSTHTYGESVVLYQIQELTTTTYLETEIGEVSPDPQSKYNKGLHTFSKVGNRYIVDGKRFVFNFAHFKRELTRKIRKVIS
jgi:hypothetical protein